MKQNFTVDASSPTITYVGAWVPIDAIDAALSFYDGATAKASKFPGSHAHFQFNGTGVWIYGAKRPNHGNATFLLDNQTPVIVDGSGPNDFKVALFSAPNLVSGLHNITILNSGGSAPNIWLDIDFIIYESDTEASSLAALVDDSNALLSYSGDEKIWQHSTNQTDSSTASSTSSSASVQLAFQGTAVAAYGSVGPNNGAYSCTIDGVTTTHNGYWNVPVPGQILCCTRGLKSGNHTLVVQNLPVEGVPMNQVLEIDSFNVWDGKGLSSTALHSEMAASNTNRKIAAIGVSCTILLFAILCGMAFYFRLRRRRQRARFSNPYIINTTDAFEPKRHSNVHTPLLKSPVGVHTDQGRDRLHYLDGRGSTMPSPIQPMAANSFHSYTTVTRRSSMNSTATLQSPANASGPSFVSASSESLLERTSIPTSLPHAERFADRVLPIPPTHKSITAPLRSDGRNNSTVNGGVGTSGSAVEHWVRGIEQGEGRFHVGSIPPTMSGPVVVGGGRPLPPAYGQVARPVNWREKPSDSSL